MFSLFFSLFVIRHVNTRIHITYITCDLLEKYDVYNGKLRFSSPFCNIIITFRSYRRLEIVQPADSNIWRTSIRDVFTLQKTATFFVQLSGTRTKKMPNAFFAGSIRMMVPNRINSGGIFYTGGSEKKIIINSRSLLLYTQNEPVLSNDLQ